MNETMYSVQRYPRSDMTMKPPIKGAIKGPVKTVMEKMVMAMPRVRLSNMSEKTAATQVSGQAPKNPLKNRQISSVCKSLETATEMLKIENPNEAITSGSRRPLSSENGALDEVNIGHSEIERACIPQNWTSRKTQYVKRGGQSRDNRPHIIDLRNSSSRRRDDTRAESSCERSEAEHGGSSKLLLQRPVLGM